MHEDAVKYTDLLLAELGLKKGLIRELQSVPMARLLAADAAVQRKITLREPGMTPSSPVVDGKVIPGHPWDPKGSGSVGGDSVADRLRPHRGDALRPADA
jgi:para-nitrobenzyl esterase